MPPPVFFFSCVEAVRQAREACGVPREGDADYQACLARHTRCRVTPDETTRQACTLAGHSATLHCEARTTGPQTVYEPLYGGPSRLRPLSPQQSAKSTSGRSSVSGL